MLHAVGYASLSAVEGQDGIKVLTVGGVECNEANILNGSYVIQRPFLLVTNNSTALSPAAQAFFDFATSNELEISGGKLTGRVTGPLCDAEGKARHLRACTREARRRLWVGAAKYDRQHARGHR